jgi:hypothetical protein
MIISTSFGLLEKTSFGEGSHQVTLQALNGGRAWLVDEHVAWCEALDLIYTHGQWLRHGPKGLVADNAAVQLSPAPCALTKTTLYIVRDKQVRALKLKGGEPVTQAFADVKEGTWGVMQTGQLYWTVQGPTGCVFWYLAADDAWIEVFGLKTVANPWLVTRNHVCSSRHTMPHCMCFPFMIFGNKEQHKYALVYHSKEYKQPDGTPLAVTAQHFLERHGDDVWLRWRGISPLGQSVEPILLVPPPELEEARKRHRGEGGDA